jgi:hypothetical protein
MGRYYMGCLGVAEMIQFIAGLFVGAGFMFILCVYFILDFIDANELGGMADDANERL